MGHGDQPQCKSPIQCDIAVTKVSGDCFAPHSMGYDEVILIHRKAGCKSDHFTCFPVFGTYYLTPNCWGCGASCSRLDIKVVRQVSFPSESWFQINTYYCDGTWEEDQGREGEDHRSYQNLFSYLDMPVVFLLGLPWAVREASASTVGTGGGGWLWEHRGCCRSLQGAPSSDTCHLLK